jgi:DNA-binding response OmpR family regulator
MTSEHDLPPEQTFGGPAALVVEPVIGHLTLVLSALSSLDFDIMVAESFQDARTSIAATHPLALLVTSVRLREYNGLHLVLRARSARPGLVAIVTAETADPVLQGETERMGATFLVMPTTLDEVAAAVIRTILGPFSPDWSPIRAPFERRHRERRTATANPGGLPQERRVADRRRDAIDALREVTSRA